MVLNRGARLFGDSADVDQGGAKWRNDIVSDTAVKEGNGERGVLKDGVGGRGEWGRFEGGDEPSHEGDGVDAKVRLGAVGCFSVNAEGPIEKTFFGGAEVESSGLADHESSTAVQNV